MMRAFLLALVLCTSLLASAEELQPLADADLSKISGADGVSFAMHLALNDPTLPNPVTDSRITMGFNADGHTTYLVIKNLRGTIDMAGTSLNVSKQADGSDYLALTLPSQVKFGNFGFDSMSAQSDPLAPVTDSIGRLNVNGSISMQGQLRAWAH
ncbi:MAG TPA: hypothetical protein VF450_13820 [Noviherbaspirillum sp.]